jgi:hypothetical protein
MIKSLPSGRYRVCRDRAASSIIDVTLDDALIEVHVDGHVVMTFGDVPLLKFATLEQFLLAHAIASEDLEPA